MPVKTKEFENQLKIWREASSKLKRVAKKCNRNITKFVEANMDKLDDNLKEELGKQICKYYRTIIESYRLLTIIDYNSLL